MKRDLKCACVALAIGATAALLPAQQVSRIAGESFKVQLEAFPPPFEMQIKTSLEGKRAESKGGSIIHFTEPRLNQFRTNGLLELQVRAPECEADFGRRTISSTNTLQIEMTDGRFFMEGRGFLRTTNGTIVLSNDVRTVIRTAAKPPARL